MKVYFSKLAENKLLRLIDYLIENWNLKVRDEFVIKLSNKINQISLQPESCPQSKEIEGLYKCVVSKQTSFYYQIHKDKKEIEIITIFDTRQNPDQLEIELK